MNRTTKETLICMPNIEVSMSLLIDDLRSRRVQVMRGILPEGIIWDLDWFITQMAACNKYWIVTNGSILDVSNTNGSILLALNHHKKLQITTWFPSGSFEITLSRFLCSLRNFYIRCTQTQHKHRTRVKVTSMHISFTLDNSECMLRTIISLHVEDDETATEPNKKKPKQQTSQCSKIDGRLQQWFAESSALIRFELIDGSHLEAEVEKDLV